MEGTWIIGSMGYIGGADRTFACKIMLSEPFSLNLVELQFKESTDKFYLGFNFLDTHPHFKSLQPSCNFVKFLLKATVVQSR